MSEETRLPGITDEQLLRRAMMNLRKRRGSKSPLRWVAVQQTFGLGSTYSALLCKSFGLDPDEELTP